MNHMLDATLHSMHPSASPEARFATMVPFAKDSADSEILECLRNAMEELVVESKLRREADAPGPLATPWATAMSRAEQELRARLQRSTGETAGDAEGRAKQVEAALPSPVSRGGTPAPSARLGALSVMPPPAGEGTGYVRARSQSW